MAYIQGHEGTRVEYSYDYSGHLVATTTALGTRTYAYNEAGLMSAVTAADGTVEVENTYDTPGRVSCQRYPHGVVRRYSYLSNGVTVVTNEDGSHANTWVSDEHGRLVGMIDAHQRRQSMGYDTFNNRVSVTERDGSSTVRLFNKRGLLTREVTPEGSDITCEYDEHDRLITMVTASGAVLSYEYADSTGEQRKPSALVDALGGRTEMVWSAGLLLSMVGPTGVGVSFTYDSFGDMVGITNAIGEVTRFERDAAGRVVSVETPLGLRTVFTYDAADNLVVREGADGALWRFSYGAGGHLREMIDPAGAVTRYEYDASGEVVAVVDPLGRRTARTFDSMGNVSSLISPTGATWGFNYDELMQNTGILDPLGHLWAREFDVNGEVAALVDPTGVRTSARIDRASGVREVTDAFGSYTTNFDAFGRAVKETSPGGSEEIFTYDAAGNVVEVLDAEGQLTVIGRDARGEITSITSPEGRVTSFTYDECGRPSTMTDSTGVVTRLAYDADSRVVSRVSSSGDVEELTYDAAGRVLTQRTSAGVARYEYDVCGRVTSIFDTKFGRRRFVYDAAHQIVKAVNGVGGVTRFEYTLDGQLASRTDPNGSVTRYTYDAAQQLVSVTDPLGRVTEASYDAAGRLLATTNPDGDELSYAYDAAGLLEKSFFNRQLIARVQRDAASRTTKIFDYSSFGKGLVDESAGTPTVHTLSYDRLGRVAEYVRKVGSGLKTDARVAATVNTTSYTYTPDGSRASVTVDGVRTDYSYGSETGLLASVLRSACSDTAEQTTGAGSTLVDELIYHYDAATAALIKITDATGAVLRSFDAVPTVVSATSTASTVEIKNSELASGRSGHNASSVRYTADGGWATVETRTHPATGEPVEFITYYNHLGLIIGADDSVDGLRLYTYDGAHQLTSVRSEAGTHTFEYSSAGFLTREVTPDGVVRKYFYDKAGQLTELTDSATGTCKYIYDGLGRRVHASGADGEVREFAYGPSGLLAQVVVSEAASDGDGTGATSSIVSLWNDALGMVASVCSSAGISSNEASVSSASGATCFLSWDVTASVPALLGVSGVPVDLNAGASLKLTGVRGVDPFGISPVLSGAVWGADSGTAGGLNDVFAGSSGVGLTAAGSLRIADLEVLGARAYDPVTRGFLSRDPLASPVGAGWGSNVYAFVGNAPVGLVDPWGLSPMTAGEFREYRQDTAGRARDRLYHGAEQFLNDHAWVVTAVTVVAAVGLMATGPLGWIGMATVGGLLSFGGSVATQKLFGGKVNLKQALTDGVIGFAAGGLGKLASMGTSALASTKVGGAVMSSAPVMRVASVFSSARSSVSSVASRVASFASPVTSRVSSAVAPVMSKAQPITGVAGQWGRNVAGQYTQNGVVGAAVESGVSGAVNNVGEYVLNAENGYEPTASGAVRAAGVGFGLGSLAPGIGSAIDDTPGLSPVRQVVYDRVTDFTLGGSNYLLSPSNDNETKDPEKFIEEGFKNALTGGSSSTGQWVDRTSREAIDRAIPGHLEGVEVSRRDFLTGNLPESSSGEVSQGYDQGRQ